MTSPKDYLTDRVKEFDSNFYIRHEVDCASEYVPMPFSPEYEKFVLRKCDCGTDELVGKIRAFLTETIQQSMEVGREEGRKETEKAFGGCTKCYGKGYSTHMGSEEGYGPIQLMDYCECERGQQLKSLSTKL